MLDELTAREVQRQNPKDWERLLELTNAVDRLERLKQTEPTGLNRAERAKWQEDLDRKHATASLALLEWRSKLAGTRGP